MLRRTRLSRLLLGASLLLAAAALTAIMGLQAVNASMQRDQVRQTRLLFDDQRTADRIMRNVRGQLFEASRYLATPRPEFLDEFRRRGTEVYGGIRYYLFRDLRMEERLLVERIKEQHAIIEVVAQDAFTLALQGRSTEARRRTEELLARSAVLEREMDALVDMRMAERTALLARHAAVERTLYGWSVALAGLFVCLIVMQGMLLQRRLLTPLLDLSAAAGRLGRGDLSVRLPVDGAEELASAAASFNGMAADLERAQARAAAAELRFHDLVQGLDAVVWERDAASGAFTFVTRRAEALLGHPVEKWLADPGFKLSITHPDDAERLRALDAEAVQAGRDFAVEYRVNAADGNELWLQDQVRVVTGPGGGAQLLRGVTLDVTGRKRADERLARAEAHYRRLVETSPYGIFALDSQGRCTEANPALSGIFGRPLAELMGARMLEAVTGEPRAVVEESFRAALAGGGAWAVEVELARPNGERRLVQLRASVVRDGDRVAGVHGVARDITDERAVERQLRRAERLAGVGTLVGGVAHELNNPLAAIKSYTQLLLGEVLDAELRDGLQVVQREADRAARVVAELRRLARDTQRAEGERARVEVAEVVAHVLRLREYELATHNVRVQLDVAPGLPPIWADRSAIEQVLLNLVVNAGHAMRGQVAPAVLTVEARAVGRNVVVTVRDTGPGIHPHHLETVFDAFFTTKPPGEGMGLGLSLVHGIVDEHGGVITVESELGHGAEFRVELPAAEALSPSAPDLPPAPVARAAGTPSPAARRVLVVDDEPAIRTVLARYLRRRGHDVEEAEDGESALQRIATAASPFDRILADLRMPGMGGDGLYAGLQALGLSDRLVFVTGDAVSPDAGRILATTGAPVVHKPFNLEELLAVVEQGPAFAGAGERASPLRAAVGT